MKMYRHQLVGILLIGLSASAMGQSWEIIHSEKEVSKQDRLVKSLKANEHRLALLKAKREYIDKRIRAAEEKKSQQANLLVGGLGEPSATTIIQIQKAGSQGVGTSKDLGEWCSLQVDAIEQTDDSTFVSFSWNRKSGFDSSAIMCRTFEFQGAARGPEHALRWCDPMGESDQTPVTGTWQYVYPRSVRGATTAKLSFSAAMDESGDVYGNFWCNTTFVIP